jgi:RNA 2',3'-cyclic 3'-phosphodiesterase
MTAAMRLFVAVNLPPAIRDAVYADAAPLRESIGAVKWVAASALHVTLKFLGERPESDIDEFRVALAEVASRHQPFDAVTTDIGAFPNFHRPRVVWLGMTNEESFRPLARDLDAALAKLGIEAERRPFQAHLTLGRLKRELSAAEAVSLAKAAGVDRPRRAFAVQAVDLMRSEPAAGGSRYSIVDAAPLQVRGT